MANGVIKTDTREVLSVNNVVLSSAIDTSSNNELTIVRSGNIVTVSGTLYISQVSIWASTTLVESGMPRPFIGQNGGFIHVLDDATIPTLIWYISNSGRMSVYIREKSLTNKTIMLTGAYVL